MKNIIYFPVFHGVSDGAIFLAKSFFFVNRFGAENSAILQQEQKLHLMWSSFLQSMLDIKRHLALRHVIERFCVYEHLTLIAHFPGGAESNGVF